MKPPISSVAPVDCEDVEGLRAIAHFWMGRCHTLELERKALLAIMSEHGIDTTVKHLIDKMNQMNRNV
jgi:hypothetical protein